MRAKVLEASNPVDLPLSQQYCDFTESVAITPDMRGENEMPNQL